MNGQPPAVGKQGRQMPPHTLSNRLQSLEEQNAYLKATMERMNQFMSELQPQLRTYQQPWEDRPSQPPMNPSYSETQWPQRAPSHKFQEGYQNGGPQRQQSFYEPQYRGPSFESTYSRNAFNQGAPPIPQPPDYTIHTSRPPARFDAAVHNDDGENGDFSQPPPPPPPGPMLPPAPPLSNNRNSTDTRDRGRRERPNSKAYEDKANEESDTSEDDSGSEVEDNNNDPPKEEPRSRVRTMITRWNQGYSKWERIEDNFEDGTDASGMAATYTKQMDTEYEKKVAFEEVEIHSEHLKRLLVETDARWRDQVEGNSHQVTLQSPFPFFVWGWDKYEKACEFQDGDTKHRRAAREDLKTLMHHIKNSQSLKSYFKSRDLLESSKKIKYEHLWTIFAHGAPVYARSYGKELQLFAVADTSAPFPTRPSSWRFRVSCSAFDWDGSDFSTYTYNFNIKEFSGEKLISSLDVFPTEYYCDEEGVQGDSQLRQKLLERGKKTYELCKAMPAQCDYDGSALVSPTGPHRLTSKGRGTTNEQGGSDEIHHEEVDVNSMDISSKVIVDNYAFLKSERNPMKVGDTPPLGRRLSMYEYDCICQVCKGSPLQQWRPGSNEEFSSNEIRLMALPPRLLGFALKDKVWGQFLVDKLIPATSFDSSTEHDESPFWDELQLEPESKKQLMALVKHHPKSTKSNNAIDPRSFDVIDGKGQGLAILLHGPPGVGKTLTAETIAIATGRPLLTVSVAEIGTDPHKAEGKMTDVFEDAARWNAVLLMDEADVFVEERVRGELQQSAYVSVLLRCLEYYEGIIILTTNRARSIDGAVQSRIHLAIQYFDLVPEQRLAIYKNRLKAMPDDEIEDRKLLEQQIANSILAKKSSKVNGRQIRNIVAGARMLAKNDKQKLQVEHLLSVHDTTSDFINSMANQMERQRGQRELD